MRRALDEAPSDLENRVTPETSSTFSPAHPSERTVRVARRGIERRRSDSTCRRRLETHTSPPTALQCHHREGVLRSTRLHRETACICRPGCAGPGFPSLHLSTVPTFLTCNSILR